MRLWLWSDAHSQSGSDDSEDPGPQMMRPRLGIVAQQTASTDSNYQGHCC